MGPWKKYLSLSLSLGFATLSSVSVYYYLNHRETVSNANTDSMVPVVVAKRNVPAGMKLTPADLAVQYWPRKEGAKDQYFGNPRELTGRNLKVDLITDEPLTPLKLLEVGENIASLIPPNMRAITISLRRSDAMAKILERGSIVDVIAMFDEGQAVPTTRVVAQAARVLMVHEGVDPLHQDRGHKNMEVTLMVTPSDAERLVIAINKGVVELVVRNVRNARSLRGPSRA